VRERIARAIGLLLPEAAGLFLDTAGHLCDGWGRNVKSSRNLGRRETERVRRHKYAFVGSQVGLKELGSADTALFEREVSQCFLL
jgi:hypothetical protein